MAQQKKITEQKAVENIIRTLFFDDELAGLSGKERTEAIKRLNAVSGSFLDAKEETVLREIETLRIDDIPTKETLSAIPPNKLTVRQAMILSAYEKGIAIPEPVRTKFPKAIAALEERGITAKTKAARKSASKHGSPAASGFWKSTQSVRNKIRTTVGTRILAASQPNAKKFLTLQDVKNVSLNSPISNLTRSDVRDAMDLKPGSGFRSAIRSLANSAAKTLNSLSDVFDDNASRSSSLLEELPKKFEAPARGTQKPDRAMSANALFRGINTLVTKIEDPTEKLFAYFMSTHPERIVHGEHVVIYDSRRWNGNKDHFIDYLKANFERAPAYFDPENPDVIHVTNEALGQKNYRPTHLSRKFQLLFIDQSNKVLNLTQATDDIRDADGVLKLSASAPHLFTNSDATGIVRNFNDIVQDVDITEIEQFNKFAKTATIEGKPIKKITAKFFRKFIPTVLDNAGFSRETIKRFLGHVEYTDVTERHYTSDGDIVAIEPEDVDELAEVEHIQAREWINSKEAEVNKHKNLNQSVHEVGIDSPSVTGENAENLPLTSTDRKGVGAATGTAVSKITIPAEGGETFQEQMTRTAGSKPARVANHRRYLTQLYPNISSDVLTEVLEASGGNDNVLYNILRKDPKLNIQLPADPKNPLGRVPFPDLEATSLDTVIERLPYDSQNIDTPYPDDYDFNADLKKASFEYEEDVRIASGKGNTNKANTPSENKELAKRTNEAIENADTPKRNAGESINDYRKRVNEFLKNSKVVKAAAATIKTGAKALGPIGAAFGVLEAGSRFYDSVKEEQLRAQELGPEYGGSLQGVTTEGQIAALEQMQANLGRSEMSKKEELYHLAGETVDPIGLAAVGFGVQDVMDAPYKTPTDDMGFFYDPVKESRKPLRYPINIEEQVAKRREGADKYFAEQLESRDKGLAEEVDLIKAQEQVEREPEGILDQGFIPQK